MRDFIIKPLTGKISLTLLFPKGLVSDLEISDEDLMKCTVEDGKLIIRKLVESNGSK